MKFPASLQQWRKNQLAVSISGSGVWLGNTLVMPFLPIFVRQLGVEGTGATAFWTGVLFAVSPALAALTGPIWGRIGDRYGMRWVTARAAAGNSLCWFLMPFADNVWHALAFRTALGVLGGFNNVSVAAITQLTPKEQTSRVIGTLQSTQILSAAVGPIVGALLAQSIGIRNTFFVTSLVMFGSFLSILLLYRDRARHSADRDATKEKRPSRGYLRKPEYLVPMLILFSIQMTNRTHAPVVPLFLEELGTPTRALITVAGALFSIAAIGEAFSAWLSGRLVGRIHINRLLLVRLGFGVAFLTPLALAQTSTAFFVWRIALAFVAGGILTLAYAAAGDVIPSEQRSSGYSILSSMLMLGGSLGPIVAGLLAGLSLRAVFFFNIAVYACLIVVVLAYGTARTADGGTRTEPLDEP